MGVFMTDDYLHMAPIRLRSKLITLEYVTIVTAISSVVIPKCSALLPWWQTVIIVGNCTSCMALLYWFERKLLPLQSFTDLQWQFRPDTSPGLWCITLLPVSILLSCYTNQKICSDVHRTCSFMAVGLLGSSILLLHNLILIGTLNSNHQPNKSNAPSVERRNAMLFVKIQVAALSIASGFAFSKFGSTDFLSSLIISASAHSLFYFLATSLPRLCPRSFTLGEAILISQAVALFTTCSILDLVREVVQGKLSVESEQVVRFCEVALLACELAVALLLFVNPLQCTTGFYGIVIVVGTTFVLPTMYFTLHHEPISWLVKYITASITRISLMGAWITFTIVSIFIVAIQQQSGSHVSTAVRKYFHALVLLVYIPGFIFDYQLLYLASCVALAVFVLMEVIRVLWIPPLGDLLNQSLSSFLDEKDQGPLILTPAFLLVGCSLPIWLIPRTDDSSLPLSAVSGLLSIGVGDAAASIGGTLFGRIKWPGTRKTIEGTVSSILAQVLACWCLGKLGMLPMDVVLSLQVILTVTLTSLLEAFTLQIDNLILPLFMFEMLLLI